MVMFILRLLTGRPARMGWEPRLLCNSDGKAGNARHGAGHPVGGSFEAVRLESVEQGGIISYLGFWA